MDKNIANQRIKVEDVDLATLKAWVGEELFDEVKIIYNPETELKNEGNLYWLFLRACMDKLIGLKRLPGDGNKTLRKIYVDMLWVEANKPKVNLVTEGISTRRSTVYTAMSNIFSGKNDHWIRALDCKEEELTLPVVPCETELADFCTETDTIFPSIEALEMKWHLPSMYFVFYDCFLKAYVGDSKWKSLCMDEKNDGKPLVPSVEEAFAFISLKNNYYAGLLEAKERLKGELVIDYDKPSLRKNKKNINVTLVKREFDLVDSILIAIAINIYFTMSGYLS